jgi:hypothetical protein
VTDSLNEQFFGTYGALNDRFGVRWMFQTDKKAYANKHQGKQNDIGDRYEIHFADVRHEGRR